MNTASFNKIYKQAKDVDIVNNAMLNTAGYFWLNLTEKQVQKMVDLIIAQGAEKKFDANRAQHYVELKNGMRLYITKR